MDTIPCTSNSGYTLLPSEEHWRQVLIFPSDSLLENGVSLHKEITDYSLWIELVTGKIWGLSFWSNTPFLSFRELIVVAQSLESAQPSNNDAILAHLKRFLRWQKVELFEFPDSSLIAENLSRSKLRASSEYSSSIKQSHDIIRQAAESCIAAFDEGLQKFSNALDQDAIGLIGKTAVRNANDVTAYNYLTHPVVKIQNYRRQAIQTFPLLLENFTSRFRQRLHQNVDSGNPLIPVIADHFSCQIHIVRFLIGKDYELIGDEWRGLLHDLMDLLGFLKPDHWPKSSTEWQQFNLWMVPCFNVMRTLRNYDYLAELLEKGLNELAREGFMKIPTRLEKHGIEMVDFATIPDFISELREWAVHSGASPESITEALMHYSVIKIAALCHRWHDWLVRWMEDEEESETKQKDSEAEWPTLISSLWQTEYHKVVPLNSPWLLQEEGRRMQHCVGQYVSKSRYFGAHIFSIRDAFTGRSLSTVELCLDEQVRFEDKIKVVQHYGRINSAPSDACKVTLRQFLNYLKETVTGEQLDEIRKQLALRCRESQEYRKLISNPAWPTKKQEGFRELLNGYPHLTAIGLSENV